MYALQTYNEHPLYQEFRATAPRIGATVDTPEGTGTVVGHNVPSDTVTVRLTDGGRRCSCSRASVCGPRQAYEAAHLADTPAGSAEGAREDSAVDLPPGSPGDET